MQQQTVYTISDQEADPAPSNLGKLEKSFFYFLMARPVRGLWDKSLATKKKEVYLFFFYFVPNLKFFFFGGGE